MPVYPKVPHRDYRTTFSLLYRLYGKLLTTVKNPEQLILMGDSAGGQIALSFAQYLKRRDDVCATRTYYFDITSIGWHI